jgi:hypothetical protein
LGIGSPEFKNFFGVRPSDQNALDLFAGEWSSAPPPSSSGLEAGEMPLYDDPRIRWAQDQLIEIGVDGGFTGRDVLELGPLEAGHTFLLDRLQARSIIAVEANGRAYLKCLLAKEAFGITRARFLLGDCVELLRASDRRYDVGVACGVLYHLTNPLELLELLARRCDALFLWTVVYDPEFLASRPGSASLFSDTLSMTHAGFEHTVHRYNYVQRGSERFSGGGHPYSHWMEKPGILGALRHFGFTEIRAEDEPNPLGPALRVAAAR